MQQNINKIYIDARTCETCFTLKHVLWLAKTQAFICSTHSYKQDKQIDHKNL